jgi:hypothetical protein
MKELGYRLYTDASDYAIAAVLQPGQQIKIKDLKGTKNYEKLQEAYKEKKPIPSPGVKIRDEISCVAKECTWGKTFKDIEVWVEE